MNSTIDYYNRHAEEYCRTTAGADLSGAIQRFAACLAPGARVLDMGCGSGRDVMTFSEMGFETAGLDASEELVKLARARLGDRIFAADISEWTADEPFDGIWCCASLMHLTETECGRFFANLKSNLKPGGALYISVKSGIETGPDASGRYMRNFTEDEIRDLVRASGMLGIRELWYTEDSLSRTGFRWLNAIIKREN